MRFLTSFCLAVLIGAGPGEAMSAESRPERAMIRVSCPQDDATSALCRELIQALARAAPGLVVSRVPRGDERPTRPGDFGVALQLSADVPPTARLEWRQGPDGQRRTGPDLSMTGSPDFTRFATDLVQSDKIMISVLDEAAHR